MARHSVISAEPLLELAVVLRTLWGELVAESYGSYSRLSVNIPLVVPGVILHLICIFRAASVEPVER